MIDFFSSILIGIGVILPGVSGSAIAMLLGVYDKVIFLLNNSKIKNLNKFILLLPIFLGIFIGILIFGNILLKFYSVYEFQMRYIFVGLIFGGIPILFGEVKEKNGNIIYKPFLISVFISLILVLIPETISYDNLSGVNPLKLFFSGILYISGKIIPGISSSFFLMLLGMYEYILSIMSNPFSFSYIDYISLIPFIIGIIFGGIILVKLINYLFVNHLSITYSIIIGFVVGSTFSIFPGIELSFRCLISFFLMLMSFYFTYKLSKNKKNLV